MSVVKKKGVRKGKLSGIPPRRVASETTPRAPTIRETSINSRFEGLRPRFRGPRGVKVLVAFGREKETVTQITLARTPRNRVGVLLSSGLVRLASPATFVDSSQNAGQRALAPRRTSPSNWPADLNNAGINKVDAAGHTPREKEEKPPCTR